MDEKPLENVEVVKKAAKKAEKKVPIKEEKPIVLSGHESTMFKACESRHKALCRDDRQEKKTLKELMETNLHILKHRDNRAMSRVKSECPRDMNDLEKELKMAAARVYVKDIEALEGLLEKL
jgi:hypothetical protein